MAGYLFTLDSVDALHRCVESGAYGTFVAEPRGRWGEAAEGTFADYATMRPGDNVYFFIDRRIYGIGELVGVGPDCKFENVPGASRPIPLDYPAIRSEMLLDETREADGERPRYQRWVCTFRPSPHFFTVGVDMDDALSSNPDAFRMLRAIWKLSFIKFSDEENQAFRDVILRSNQTALNQPVVHQSVFEDKTASSHDRILQVVQSRSHLLDAHSVLSACAEGDALRHEMALEAGLLSQLAGHDPETVSVMGGPWDYLSHQVVASPFKPIDYMDKMDVFGYAYIPQHRPTIARYLVAELKRSTAGPEEIEQVMKYVDWVKDEYAHGDYSAIRAFLVAYDFAPDAEEYADEFARRMYTIQRRPARSEEWTSLRLIRYRYDDAIGRIRLYPLASHTVASSGLASI